MASLASAIISNRSDARVFVPTEHFQWSWIELTGPDAKDFLHRLTTVNLKLLEVGQGSHGTFLSGVGRVLAAFTLWRLEDERFGFEFEAGRDGCAKKRLVETIEKFHFGERMKLSTQFEESCVFVVGDESPNALRTEQVGEVRVCLHGSHYYGKSLKVLWGEKTELESLTQGLPQLSESELERMRIENVSPRLGFEISDQVLPLEAGMLAWVAEGKGCYPGQEVIERIFTYGSPPRRLCLLEFRGRPPVIGTKLLKDGIEFGAITSVAEGSPPIGLALIRKIQAREGFEFQIEETHVIVRKVAPYAHVEK